MIILSAPCGCKMSDYVLLISKFLLKQIKPRRIQFYVFNNYVKIYSGFNGA